MAARRTESSDLQRLQEDDLDPLSKSLLSRLQEVVKTELKHILSFKEILLRASFLDPRFRYMRFCKRDEKEEALTSVLEEACKVTIGKFKLKGGDEEGEPAEGPNPLAIFQASVFGVATNPSEPEDRAALKKAVKWELHTYASETQVGATECPLMW